MSEILRFEDIKEAQEITPLRKDVTAINLVMYCATVWLTDRIHYDAPYAKERGLPGPVTPGNMGVDWYIQLLNDWLGQDGELRRLSTQYRQFMTVGDTITCSGKVIAKYEEDDKKYVDLELWMHNQRGENCIPGRATVELKS